ncbi:hypothetical protein TELCIR_12747 [Teladorsagia circumcincta]|uniref:Uncharacterized protein n=1 Tax=Teladorsagia circumcincta TaxID=45464 RepID=A0A2G9U5S7_TELCI|nr:hypothetical protein TELCIR_12747 [Teladorsagia circumcincta]
MTCSSLLEKKQGLSVQLSPTEGYGTIPAEYKAVQFRVEVGCMAHPADISIPPPVMTPKITVTDGKTGEERVLTQE